MENAFLKAAASGDVATLQSLLSTSRDTQDAEGKTALHHATFEGQEAAVVYLLKEGLAVDARTKKGLTPFHYAVFRGHLGVARVLLANGADSSAVDATGRAAVHLASAAGSRAILEWLVSDDVRADASVVAAGADSMRCEHFAALSGHTELLEYLSARTGAPLDSRTAMGMTPLHLACMKGHLAAAEYLVVSGGASVSAIDSKGRAPLHLAVSFLHAPLAAWLISAGADARAPDGDGKTPIALASAPAAAAVAEVLAAAIAPPPSPGAPSRLSVDAAAELGVTLPAASPTRLWLRWAEPSMPPPGAAAVAYAVQVTAARGGFFGGAAAEKAASLVTLSAGGSEEVAAETIDTAACVDALAPATVYTFRVRARNTFGWGPWSARSEELSTPAADAPPLKGRSQPVPQAEGGVTDQGSVADEAAKQQPPTPLPTGAYEAAAAGDVSALKALAAEFGAGALRGVCAGSDGGVLASSTLLHIAASVGAAEALSWLISESGGGAASLLDARDARGCTPLLLAIVGAHVPAAKVLAAQGASLNAPDLAGYGPLHYAALRSHTAALRWLLEAGADATARSSRGTTTRETLEDKMGKGGHGAIAPVLAPEGGSEERGIDKDKLFALIANAECLPLAPPPPSVLETTATGIAIVLPMPKWAQGSPAPCAFEVQIAKRSGLAAAIATLWETAVETAPAGVNVVAPAFCGSTWDFLQKKMMSGGGGSPPEDRAPPAPANPNLLVFRPVVLIIGGLSPDTKYAFQIRARNAHGFGPWSARSADVMTLSSSSAGSFSSEASAAAASSAAASAEVVRALRALGTSNATRGRAAFTAAVNATPLLRPPTSAVLAALRGERERVPAPSVRNNASETVSATLVPPPGAASAPSAIIDAALTAASAGDMDALRAAVDAGAIHIAAYMARSEDVRALLIALGNEAAKAADAPWAGGSSESPEEFVADRKGWTPAHWAAANVSSSTATLLALRESAPRVGEAPDSRGLTPAHVAAAADAVAFLRALPRSTLDSVDAGGLAPAHVAAAAGATAALAYLLWSAADLGLADAASSIDALGRTPIVVAREAGAAASVRILEAWESRKNNNMY